MAIPRIANAPIVTRTIAMGSIAYNLNPGYIDCDHDAPLTRD